MPNPRENIEAPATPPDAMYVSGSEDGILTVKFKCHVMMLSGRTLGPFECDEITSVGWTRNQIQKELEILYNKRELDCVDFHFMRDGGQNHSTNACTKIFELVDIRDAVLSISHDTGGIERASSVQRPRS